MTIYLYLKTHNKTGLMYLGKTVKDPFKYHGSGKRWKNHLKVHGKDITTEILFQTEDIDEFRIVALIFSHALDIVESDSYANLTPENGEGGDTFSGKKHSTETIKLMKERAKDRPPMPEEVKQKISTAKTGVKTAPHPKRTEEYCKALSERLKGKEPWNKGVSGYNLVNIEVACPHCGAVGRAGGFHAWHFDNCLILENSARMKRCVGLNDNIFLGKSNGKPALICKITVRGERKRRSIYVGTGKDIDGIYDILRKWRDETLRDMGVELVDTSKDDSILSRD